MGTGNERMRQLIMQECNAIAKMLVEKNRSYGNSVANNEQIFSKVDAMEAINVRIDDKLRRIKAGHEYKNEDTEMDLIGYLILKRCVRSYLAKPAESNVCGEECCYECQKKQFEEDFAWKNIPIEEISDDELDRAADFFLAHTRGGASSSQSKEGICKNQVGSSREMAEEDCGCRIACEHEVLCEDSKQRHGSVCSGEHV
jgi:hypothetical protein